MSLNNLKVIHDLYSQCLTQALSKTTSFTNMEGVHCTKLFSQTSTDLPCPNPNQIPKRFGCLIRCFLDAGSRYLVIWMFSIGDAYASDALPGTS